MMMKKSNSPAVFLSLLTVIFFAASNGYSEAEAAFLANECSGLNQAVFDKMTPAQQSLSHKCASIEAAQAWEQSYGNLNEEMIMAGVVYE